MGTGRELISVRLEPLAGIAATVGVWLAESCEQLLSARSRSMPLLFDHEALERERVATGGSNQCCISKRWQLVAQ